MKAGHFELDGGFLNCPDAHLTPAGDGHHLDIAGFRGIARLDLIFKLAQDLLKAMLRFTFKDHGAAEDAVLSCVLRGGGFGPRGGRAAVLGAVGSGGFGFA